MIKIKEIDNKTAVGYDSSSNCEYKFEIVKSIPKGFTIWNIGNYIEDGYLPIVRGLKGSKYTVNTNCMKLIKTPLAQTILDGIGFTGSNLKKMEIYANRYKDICGQKVAKSLEALKQLKEEAK